MDADFDTFCSLPPSYASQPLPIDIPWQAAGATFRQIPFGDDYTFCMCTPSSCQWNWIFPNTGELW